MKYIQQRGNSFVFDDDDGRDLKLTRLEDERGAKRYGFLGKLFLIVRDGQIGIGIYNICEYYLIEKAVAMMQILIDEGVV